MINTGWSSASGATASDILTLWGVDPNVGSSAPDAYSLSLTTNKSTNASYRLAALDQYGNWVNAVNLNVGGSQNFVAGPWAANYPLGTYGVDTTTNTAWAVLNFNGKFAVLPFAVLPKV